MKPYTLSLISVLIASPVLADNEAPLTEQKAQPPKADVATAKEALGQGKKQETVALGGNRFLIFSGIPAAHQIAYSVDLVKIDGGVPHFEPFYMQEYDPKENKLTLTDGTGFAAVSYHFDKASGELSYTMQDAENEPRMAFKYKLDGDTLVLQEMVVQEKADAKPETLFKAGDNKVTDDAKKS